MKKGLLIWKAQKGKRKNIGDYIQSVAAQQYTGKDVVYVQAEEQHEYTGERVKLIMNGWFMHKPENWPPAKQIVPLITSFHINPANGPRMLSEEGVAYFKEYVKNFGPVGARDRDTERLLKSRGIDAKFTGCLTLTLGKTFKHYPSGKNVCFVDPFFEASNKRVDRLGYLFTLVLNYKAIVKISKKLYKSTSRKSLLRSASFFKTYSRFFEKDILENAEYIKHVLLESRLGNEEDKFQYAKNLLQKYAYSRLVVTSRIHAALPCLAMDTPVIFIIADDLQPNGKGVVPYAKGRFDGMLELFHVMECINYKLKPILGFKVEKKIGFNHSIRNKQNHLKIAADLDKSCTTFINTNYEVGAGIGV
jgi:hypothetical protein